MIVEFTKTYSRHLNDNAPVLFDVSEGDRQDCLYVMSGDQKRVLIEVGKTYNVPFSEHHTIPAKAAKILLDFKRDQWLVTYQPV